MSDPGRAPHGEGGGAPAFDVLDSGLVAVQDLGRPGHAHLGVAANGAADVLAARRAGALVGNVDTQPVLEGVSSGLTLRAARPLLLALTGAAAPPRVWRPDSPEHPVDHPALGEPFALATGSVLEIRPAAVGMRWYLALNGTLDVPRLLGSVAPDSALGFGTTLREGGGLRLRSRFDGIDHPFSRIPLFRVGGRAPAIRADHVIDVTPGPDARDYDDLDALFRTPYRVTPRGDQVGVRLDGEVPRRRGSREILSRGVPVGAIELPPGGEVIALLRGRFVTAGYPIPAVATAAGIDGLAQLRPGETAHFRLVTTADAVAGARRRDGELTRLRERVARAFTAAGLGHVLAR